VADGETRYSGSVGPPEGPQDRRYPAPRLVPVPRLQACPALDRAPEARPSRPEVVLDPDLMIYLGPGVGLAILGLVGWYLKRR
jgi:hypothetical protein